MRHVLLLLLCACGAADMASVPGGNSFVVRDSAGITIAENVVADPPGIPFWTVDSVPALTIGVAAGDSAYELSGVKGITQLPGGMLVVLNGQGESAYEFRFYGPDGKHVVTHGRRGNGPGDFRWVNFFGGTGGDTLIAVDFSTRRINWLSASAGHVRSIRSDDVLLRSIVGNHASGLTETMIPLGDSLYAVKSFHDGLDPSIRRRGNEFHIIDLAAGTTQLLTRLQEPESKPVQLSKGRTIFFAGVPGESDPMHVVDRSRSRICAGINSAAEIQCLDADGKRRIIRWAYTPVAYGAAEKSEYTNRIKKSSTPGEAAELVNAYNAHVWPEEYPPFGVLQIDINGNFWLLETMRGANGKPAERFRVLDPDGRLIAFATSFPVMPVGFNHSHEIGDTLVLRAITSAEGAPQVGGFRIAKGRP